MNVQFKIGNEPQEIAFPDDIDQVLDDYIQRSGITLSYIVNVGIDEPALISESLAMPSLVQAYACVKQLREDPLAGLTVLSLANALVNVGQFDAAKVLRTCDGWFTRLLSRVV